MAPAQRKKSRNSRVGLQEASQGNFNTLRHELSEVQERLRQASGHWRRRNVKDSTSLGAWEAARSQSPAPQGQPVLLGQFVEDSRRELSAFRIRHPRSPSLGRKTQPSGESVGLTKKRGEQRSLMQSTMTLLESLLRAPSTDSTSSSPLRQAGANSWPPSRLPSRERSMIDSFSRDGYDQLAEQRTTNPHPKSIARSVNDHVERGRSSSPSPLGSKLTASKSATTSDVVTYPSWISTSMQAPDLQDHGEMNGSRYTSEMSPNSQPTSGCHSMNVSHDFQGRMLQSDARVRADETCPSPPRLLRPSSAPTLRRLAGSTSSSFMSTRPDEMRETRSSLGTDSQERRSFAVPKRTIADEIYLPSDTRSFKRASRQQQRKYISGHRLESSSETPAPFSPLSRSSGSAKRSASDVGRLLKRSPSRQYVLTLERELAQLRSENTYLRMSLLAEPSVQRPRRQRRASSASNVRNSSGRAYRNFSRPQLSRPSF